jgi:hypothetical protein
MDQLKGLASCLLMFQYWFRVSIMIHCSKCWMRLHAFDNAFYWCATRLDGGLSTWGSVGRLTPSGSSPLNLIKQVRSVLPKQVL